MRPTAYKPQARHKGSADTKEWNPRQQRESWQDKHPSILSGQTPKISTSIGRIPKPGNQAKGRDLISFQAHPTRTSAVDFMARATSSKNPEEKRHPGFTKLRINEVKTRVRKDFTTLSFMTRKGEGETTSGRSQALGREPNSSRSQVARSSQRKTPHKGCDHHISDIIPASSNQRVAKIILGRSTRNLVTRGTRAEGIVTKKARRKTRKTVSNTQREKVILFETTLKKKRW